MQKGFVEVFSSGRHRRLSVGGRLVEAGVANVAIRESWLDPAVRRGDRAHRLAARRRPRPRTSSMQSSATNTDQRPGGRSCKRRTSCAPGPVRPPPREGRPARQAAVGAVGAGVVGGRLLFGAAGTAEAAPAPSISPRRQHGLLQRAYAAVAPPPRPPSRQRGFSVLVLVSR